MKKILLTMLCLCLVACSNSSKTASNIDLSKTENELDSYYTNMNDMDSDQLLLIYDLDVSLCDSYIIKSSSVPNGNFYAILQVNSDNKSKVMDQMKSLFNTMIEQSNLYTPEAVSLIKNRLETNVGDYLIYLVGEDTNALYEIVKRNIN